MPLRRNDNENENTRSVTTGYLPWKEKRKVKNWDVEILGFDLAFLGKNNTVFIFCFWFLSMA